jgi:enoyl-CoA hydratase
VEVAVKNNPFAPEVLVESDGAVRIVTLNRPEALNAANPELHRGVVGIWRHIAADPEARAVVITGAGRAFSTGGDFHHLQDVANDRELRRSEIDNAAALVREMADFRLPVIAAVNGPAVGLGCNIAVLSDIVLIAADAYIADPHVSIGLTAADGGAPSWPMFMSLLRAKEYLFTGDRIPADVAVQLGLANRVVAPEQLRDEALSLAKRLAAQPAHALQSTKAALNLHLKRAISGVLEYALAEEFKSFDDAEHRAIVEAFLAKRKPPEGS